jgi:hypothetical protein
MMFVLSIEPEPALLVAKEPKGDEAELRVERSAAIWKKLLLAGHLAVALADAVSVSVAIGGDALFVL